MRIAVALLGLLLCADARAQAQFSLQPAAPGGAAGSPELFGVWGTAAQCAAYRADAFVNPGLHPYHISDEWIRQGGIYCYLRWRGAENDVDGLAAYADAQCGEDTLREFELELRLQRQRLRITWSTDFTTAALRRCDSD